MIPQKMNKTSRGKSREKARAKSARPKGVLEKARKKKKIVNENLSPQVCSIFMFLSFVIKLYMHITI